MERSAYLILDSWAARARIAAMAENVKPLAANGTNQHGIDNYKTLSLDTPSIIGGTSPEYLTARIARDRPDILERMKAAWTNKRGVL